jgi:hypothetical protein
VTGRRAVRVLPEFFILLDEQLPHERGPHDEPSAAEFAASDLLDIVGTFAASWDDLPMPIAGRLDYRVQILTGRLVHAAAVRGRLSPVDGAVELIDIAIDLYGPDGPPTQATIMGSCATREPCTRRLHSRSRSCSLPQDPWNYPALKGIGSWRSSCTSAVNGGRK